QRLAIHRAVCRVLLDVHVGSVRRLHRRPHHHCGPDVLRTASVDPLARAHPRPWPYDAFRRGTPVGGSTSLAAISMRWGSNRSSPSRDEAVRRCTRKLAVLSSFASMVGEAAEMIRMPP